MYNENLANFNGRHGRMSTVKCDFDHDLKRGNLTLRKRKSSFDFKDKYSKEK